MIGKRFIKNRLNEIKNEKILSQDKKTKIRLLTKQVRLSKNVKYVLNSLSHYKFRQHLLNKGKEYGCEKKNSK
jgi:hypothetical protein